MSKIIWIVGHTVLDPSGIFILNWTVFTQNCVQGDEVSPRTGVQQLTTHDKGLAIAEARKILTDSIAAGDPAYLVLPP